MLAKVPPNIQVRLLRPQAEDRVPHIAPEPPISKPKHFYFNILKRFASGTGISFIIGFGLFTILKVVGLDFGPYETSIVILLPSMLGFLTSFVIL